MPTADTLPPFYGDPLYPTPAPRATCSAGQGCHWKR